MQNVFCNRLMLMPVREYLLVLLKLWIVMFAATIYLARFLRYAGAKVAFVSTIRSSKLDAQWIYESPIIQYFRRLASNSKQRLRREPTIILVLLALNFIAVNLAFANWPTPSGIESTSSTCSDVAIATTIDQEAHRTEQDWLSLTNSTCLYPAARINNCNQNNFVVTLKFDNEISVCIIEKDQSLNRVIESKSNSTIMGAFLQEQRIKHLPASLTNPVVRVLTQNFPTWHTNSS